MPTPSLALSVSKPYRSPLVVSGDALPPAESAASHSCVVLFHVRTCPSVAPVWSKSVTSCLCAATEPLVLLEPEDVLTPLYGAYVPPRIAEPPIMRCMRFLSLLPLALVSLCIDLASACSYCLPRATANSASPVSLPQVMLASLNASASINDGEKRLTSVILPV